ncbi:hypothetical protein McpCs1_18790 [Methanocorpusculaceae archaeon Cs1]|uniref:PGF-CTERM archaeal protein-sorting signal domain-containing protein n=2 Tax=Methanorbis rubei TaxID=3028300 RepID=A0AAE4MHX2_9EURY|nr:hypothetical protein [Methanocorpusculaceae archaeon Cs1]
MKIMALLAVVLSFALLMGAASAANTTLSTDAVNAPPLLVNNSGDINYTIQYAASLNPAHNTSGSFGYFATGDEFKTADGLNVLKVVDVSNVTINNTTTVVGVYSKLLSFPTTTYQLNVTSINTETTDVFAANDSAENTMQRYLFGNTVTVLKYPDGSLMSGITFTSAADSSVKFTTNADGQMTGLSPGLYTVSIAGGSASVYFQVTKSVSPVGADYVTRSVTSKSGADVFVFEHIVFQNAAPGTVQKLTKYTDGMNPTAVNQISSDSNGIFYLTEAVVNGQYGGYYLDAANPISQTTGPDVYIWYPEISLQAELTTNSANGMTAGDSIDGQTVNKDTNVSFLINAPKVGPAFYDKDNASNSSYAKIVFTTPVAGKTTDFGGKEFGSVQLTASQTIAGWGAAGQNAAAGTYTAQAEYKMPKAFADYAKKSNTISFTLQSSTLTITAAKDSVVRSNPFTVTISGKAQTVYAIYLENAIGTEVNPELQPSQNGYQGAFTIDNTLGNSVPVYGGAFFKTDASGKRTIQYNTAANTEDKTYTVKVNGIVGTPVNTSAVLDTSDYDKVKVKVEKGAVTITASGDGSYYIGDEIKLTGTNTDSSNVYLFLTGQNLLENGIVLKDLPAKVPAYNATNPVAVKTDNTWEYKWDTSQIALDTGAYTIYATSRLTNGKSSTAVGNAVKLSDSEYATISVNLKQPFLSAVPSGTVIAQGDKLYVRGTAEGKPNNLMLYIFGPNFFEDHSITVEDDGSYEKKIDISSSMSSNQYFVVVQHPMYNGVFDAVLVKEQNGDYQYFKIQNATTGGSQQASFVVWGNNKLQGSQAADALTKMIDDANIDDIYTKLTFTVAAPWIRINNPGDQAVGSKFTVTGTTNLAIGDQILVEVMSSSFTAVDKTSTSTTSGVSQTTKVVAGEGADNAWAVDVDTTNWKLDEYTIKVNGIEVDVTSTTNFNLVEKVVTPTPTATGAQPTTTTATATPTATPSTPGFGAFIALAGLGAVALLVLRRN